MVSRLMRIASKISQLAGVPIQMRANMEMEEKKGRKDKTIDETASG